MYCGEGIRIYPKNGIELQTPSFSVALDPKAASSCDYSFVSHAHIDHVHPHVGNSQVVSSKQTAKLAILRGYDLGNTIEEAPGIELFDAGHILGSRAVLIKDRVLYTGDISCRDRAFLKGCGGVRCETLIMETTYGSRRYFFPKTDGILRDANSFISRCFDRGRPVILTGYPLGKAQLISYFFENWDPVYLHESVYPMNSAHLELGVKLRILSKFESSDGMDSKLARGPWLLIAPMSSRRSNLIRALKQKYNAAVAAFSGWSVDSFYKRRLGLDEAFPLSDHCDFNELVSLAKYCSPSRIYTVHGFDSEFAAHLRTMGFDAQPLSQESFQERITNYA